MTRVKKILINFLEDPPMNITTSRNLPSLIPLAFDQVDN